MTPDRAGFCPGSLQRQMPGKGSLHTEDRSAVFFPFPRPLLPRADFQPCSRVSRTSSSAAGISPPPFRIRQGNPSSHPPVPGDAPSAAAGALSAQISRVLIFRRQSRPRTFTVPSFFGLQVVRRINVSPEPQSVRKMKPERRLPAPVLSGAFISAVPHPVRSAPLPCGASRCTRRRFTVPGGQT